MFLASTSRLYARETTEEEFIRYVRDNGVSAALQPALILLYRLPIKPNNLKEFFAEYLENGACILTNISLLRAELCYLQSEEENLQLRLRKLDRDLEDMSNVVKNINIKEADALVPEKPNASQIPDLMTRFVEDTKKNPSNNYNPFDLSTPDFQAQEITASEEEEEEEGEGAEKAHIGVARNFECIEKKESLLDMIDDLKEFDPWGMIFKYYDTDLKYEVSKPKTDGNQNNTDNGVAPYDNKHGLTKDNSNEKASVIGGSNDSEDADTLVELFHAKILPDDQTNDILLLKQKSEKLSFSDLMGWGNYQSKEYKSFPKYPLHMARKSRPNALGKQDIKGQVSSSPSTCTQNNRNIKNLVKFYSQLNTDVAEGDLFTSFDKYYIPLGDDTYTKGIQTDILQEFEEFDGEDWEWEWDSDDYLLPETNSLANKAKSKASEKDDNGNILLGEGKKGYIMIGKETYANEAEIFTDNSLISQQKQLELLPSQQSIESTQKMISPDTLSQQCSSQSEKGPPKNLKMGRQNDTQDIKTKKLLVKTDKKISKYAYNTKPYSRYRSKSPKPNANSQGNRKTAKLLKYINEIYDSDTASKLQQQFDFRIFED